MLTVQTCIENLNQEGFYTKKIQNSIFKNINIAMCYLSVVKYEKTFYNPQIEAAATNYTQCNNKNHTILNELKNDIKHITLKHKDNTMLDCWDINPKNSDKYIIVFNGIGSEKDNKNLQQAYLKIVQNGYGVIAFDYRGRGKSSGIFSQKNANQDANLVFQYLSAKGIKEYDTGIIGHSMGAAVALDFAKDKNMAFVILINPFNKAADMVKNIAQKLCLPSFIQNTVKNLPDWLLPIKNRFNNEKTLSKIYSPTLLLHTKDDNTIPVALCKKLYEKNADKKNITCIELDGCDHEINNEKIDAALGFIEGSKLWLFNK